ncbi:Ycs4p [Paramicrosporidium saccamoebae]|uniref:Condensin complex subunit 1 n=1 Tax=Paramicrosporidium saccamoebae TaxID=1246581 RepID=A0A2H9TNB3_9FUNG|nr:Ycs4p [Paramicrosporidium saccamoebae]
MLRVQKTLPAAIGVSEQLLAIPTWPNDLSKLRLTPKEIEREIKRCFPSLEIGAKAKLINAVISGVATISKLMHSSKSEMAQEALEAMAILAYATVSAAEKDKPAVTSTKKGRGESLDWNHNKIVLAESFKAICTLPVLPRLYQTYSDLENLVCTLSAHLTLYRHVGGVPFSADDSGAAKIVSAFLLKLTVCDTRGVLRNVTALADFLDSDLYSMRMSMLEIFAILYCHLMLQDDRSDQTKTRARSFLGAIEERLRDVNSFVRSKALQVLSQLVQANTLPVADRSHLVDLVVGRVMDKSSNVRRRAIQLLGEFLKRHPFCVDGGELSLSLFEDRLQDVESNLDRLEPAEIKESMTGSTEELAVDDGADAIAKAQELQTLLMQKRYYTDAIAFVRQLDSVIPTLCQLLSSHTKTEVFEVMDFFVDSCIYKLQSSDLGIKKMMHLIWEQDLSTEDGGKKSVKEHVLGCYRRVFLEVDSRLDGKQRIMTITQNLIKLVSTASSSDLASLEQIVVGFIKKDWISDAVKHALAYSFANKLASVSEQRSALVLMTMIGTCDPEIITSRVDSLLKIGFGPVGMSDSWIAEYTCIALKLIASSIRLPNDNIIFLKLTNMLKAIPSSPRWLQVAGQAIMAIYSLADQPNLIVSTLIREISREVTESVNGNARTRSLVKLIFIVGHVAVSEVDHLEAVEKHWKQTKAKSSTRQKEDDIVDAVRYMRENELLYGKDSILSDPQLQNVASMALAKFMSVSGQYCDQYLPLFLTILEKSPDSNIRNNLTVAFADLAQSFGRIIDSNIVYLFRRLCDPDVTVKRNALMVLTHLTLTGLIKVKGQVGEIAKCILDEDSRVSSLARLFFHEMAGKDNAIYNHIPDIISSLSMNDNVLSEDDFKTIAKFIFEYIKKERQMEGLVEKLCQRFRQCSDMRQARDLACCLTMINFTSEKTIRRLVESLPLYRDKLVDIVVYRYFVETLQRARKGTKTEVRAMLDEFEQKLLQAAGEAESDVAGAADVAGTAEAIDQLTLQASSQRGKKAMPKRRVNRRRETEAVTDEEEDVIMQDIMSEPDDLPESPQKKGVTASRKPVRSRRIIAADSNDDEDDVF